MGCCTGYGRFLAIRSGLADERRHSAPPCRLGVGAKKTRRRYVCGLKNILLH